MASAVSGAVALVFPKELGLTFPHLLWCCRAGRRNLSKVMKGHTSLIIDSCVNSDPFFQALMGDGNQDDVTVRKK